ncbi:Protein kinase C signaling pathway involved MAPKK protein [Coemansia spiralis]|uniref:Protein kinase C signaling pathway involved MAPKK protein n=2 Tax=Coemansia TaxID=4863 RepID=A0A9W8GAA8_9FUNG|nr:kinase-like domain-containing protein [Coemansia spiralis]KAJ1993028.1 Protein kinase C signaling pathway involved MAPKK protein [Coemansia umbellata]KAJ2622908.1 Protein kinase C signaling pathway involved MAPKK protein [Coemansia sp. RSA 1358]KAJ2678177.1 Protein kinase C signaling pathway involved MAPKK protein [Coemansia spiralis]
MALSRSNATNRTIRPAPRLYAPTTPRGLPHLPRLNIPQMPQIETRNLPLISSDHAARQQSRELHQELELPESPEHLDEDEYVLKDENILVMRKLGEGSVGTVHKVEYLPTRKIMARKTMAVYPDEANHKQIVRELRLLKQCQSPYIVKFFGAYFSDDNDGQSIAICMEYCEGGSLEAVYKRAAQLNAQIGEGVLGKVALAVLNGLVHLHSYRVIHRDVKPSNILVTGRGEIKLCDFGVSGELVDSIAQTFVGTSYYMAPERIQGDRYAVQSDVWSLGLTLIEASQNQFPFPPPGHPQLSVIELLEYIIHMPVPEMDTRFSDECRDFVRVCLIKDPKERPTPQQLLRHAFVVRAAAKKLDLKSWIERVWGFKK